MKGSSGAFLLDVEEAKHNFMECKMKKILILSAVAVLGLSAPAHAQLLNSGNSGLLGLGNNLLSLQTGNVSVLNGGILNGSNVLSGIGLGSSANAAHSSTVTSGTNNTVVQGRGNTVGNGNAVGVGNAVDNTSIRNTNVHSFNRNRSGGRW